MDAARFTEAKTGQLVKIPAPGGETDWAFVPDPLPPRWEFPARLWPMLSKANQQLARLDEKGKAIKNPALLLAPLQSREAVSSSGLEGTYVTPKELLLYEVSPADPKTQRDRSNEEREVANYSRALRYGFGRLTADETQGLPLGTGLAKEMHDRLVAGVRGHDKGAGQIRTRQVYVGSDRRYIPPPPGEHLDRSLRELEAFMNNHGNAYDPLVLSYLAHYQFEAIHPFLDGNGRIGRALLSLTTYMWSKLDVPWLYMSAYFEKYKREYIDNMFDVSTHGDWDKWIEFCLRGTIQQCQDALDTCQRILDLQDSMHEAARKKGLSLRLHRIINKMFEAPVFTVALVAEWGQSSSPTARGDIAKLMEAGFVDELEDGRPRKYFAPHIFRAAYEDYDEDHANNTQKTIEGPSEEKIVGATEEM